MEEQETVSISKGCFLFQPKKFEGSPQKKRKTPDKKSKSAKYMVGHGYSFPETDGESEKLREIRFRLYEECLVNIQEHVEEIQTDLNYKVFSDLVDYITKAHNRSIDKVAMNEIPTAALFAGVNMPDHHAVFEQLREEIMDQNGSNVALLHSKDCSSLKLMLKETLSQLMYISEDDKNNLDDSMSTPSKSSKVVKRYQYSFSELKQWYLAKETVTTLTPTKSSGKRTKKKAHETEGRPSLVIIFEDFEGFNAKVLQDFILICSNYIQELPLVLVFGVATTANAIHQSLSYAVSSQLSITKFQAQPPLLALTEIIDEVLLSNKHAWRLGPSVLGMLYDNFLYYDFSIQNFVKGLKLSIMEHFYHNTLSLICTFDTERIRKNVFMMSKVQCNVIREIPSVTRYISRKSLSDQKMLKTDDRHFKDMIVQLAMELHDKVSVIFPVLKCLQIMTSKLPGLPLGKQVANLFEVCYKKNITTCESYTESIELMRLMSRDELFPLLKNCLNTLANAEINTRTVHLIEQRDGLERLLSKLEANEGTSVGEVDEKTAKTNISQDKTPVYRNRYEFQEKLKKAVKEKRRESPFEKLRNEIVDFLNTTFRQFLGEPLAVIPLVESLFFDRKDSVEKIVNAAPRLSLQRALVEPHHYLKCTCCNIEPDAVQDTLPDLSILYKLHLECGKLINLYDWLQSFQAVVSSIEEYDERSNGGEGSEETNLARFICGVSALQLLGFIKATKRKTDHVARLTWGKV